MLSPGKTLAALSCSSISFCIELKSVLPFIHIANLCFASLDKDLLTICPQIRLISVVKSLLQGHLLHNSWLSVLQDILDSPKFIFATSCVQVSCWPCPSSISPILLLFSYLLPQTGNTILVSQMELNRLLLCLTHDSGDNASQNESSRFHLSVMLSIHHKLYVVFCWTAALPDGPLSAFVHFICAS